MSSEAIGQQSANRILSGDIFLLNRILHTSTIVDYSIIYQRDWQSEPFMGQGNISIVSPVRRE
jgi:hypothetical protein